MLSYKQAEVVSALADSGLSIRKAAKRMNKSPSSIYHHVARIRTETEKEPLDFHDMIVLYDEAKSVLSGGKPKIIRCEDCDNWDPEHTAGSKEAENLTAHCAAWSDQENGHTRYTPWNGWCHEAEERGDDDDF